MNVLAADLKDYAIAETAAGQRVTPEKLLERTRQLLKIDSVKATILYMATAVMAARTEGAASHPKEVPYLKVKPPAGKFGTTTFGNKIQDPIVEALKAKFPGVEFEFRIKPGQNGVDVRVLDDLDVQVVGFKYADIKPNSVSGQSKLGTQEFMWQSDGTIPSGANVQPLAYEANGNVHLGFRLPSGAPAPVKLASPSSPAWVLWSPLNPIMSTGPLVVPVPSSSSDTSQRSR